METMASVVFECPFDDETLKTLQDLRVMRLDIARKQLTEVGRTVRELVKRELLADGDRAAMTESLKVELSEKVKSLELRTGVVDTIFSDEIEIYLDLVSDHQAKVAEKSPRKKTGLR
jgi:hypothetical protein